MSGDVIGVGGLLLTNIGVMIGMFRYFNSRIARVFERFDEYKNDINSKFVVKDLCKVMHENNASNLGGLEARLNQRLESLEKKTDDNFKVVIDLMKK